MKTPEQRLAAIALVYNEKASAPRVAAKGNGLVAEAIVRRARGAGIYVHESPALVALLMKVDLDSHIPQELYMAVAELLVWLYKIEHAPSPNQEHIDPAPPGA